jgi:hypothetical protein
MSLIENQDSLDYAGYNTSLVRYTNTGMYERLSQSPSNQWNKILTDIDDYNTAIAAQEGYVLTEGAWELPSMPTSPTTLVVITAALKDSTIVHTVSMVSDIAISLSGVATSSVSSWYSKNFCFF